MQIKVLGGIRLGHCSYMVNTSNTGQANTLIKKSWMEMINHVSMETLLSDLQAHNTFQI